MADIAETVREGLLAMSVVVGFRVLAEMMEEELPAKVGAKHARCPVGRSAVTAGAGSRVQRPRDRTVQGEEIALDTYVAQPPRLPHRFVSSRGGDGPGLATRRHRAANLSELDVAVLMVDGVKLRRALLRGGPDRDHRRDQGARGRGG